MPPANTDTGTSATPLYDANATAGGKETPPSTTTNTTTREPQPHPSAIAVNIGIPPSTTAPTGDPHISSRKPQGPLTTTTANREAVSHRSPQVPTVNPGGTLSTAPPPHDPHASSRRAHNPSTSGTTSRGNQPYRSAQEAYHGRSDDKDKSDSGSRKSSRYNDPGGQRPRGDEGERKGNVLKKPTPTNKEVSTRSTSTRERDESLFADSVDITDRRSDHTSTASAQAKAQASLHAQARLGSQNTTSYAQVLVKDKSKFANHTETRSNAPVTRASDSTTTPQTSRPPGAAEAQPPSGSRHPESQPGEDESIDNPPTQPLHEADDSVDDFTQPDSEDSDDSSHPHPPGGLSAEQGQSVQGEGGEAHIAQSSGYFGGIGRSIAGVILGPGGPAQPPRDRTKEELHRTRARLQQLEHEFRRARGDNANLHRACFELDSENKRQKDTIRSLQHELTNMGRELQEYKNLSDIRGKELIGAQVFLTKADLLSISDVKDKVNALNDECFQASASLGDSLIHLQYEVAKEELDAAFVDVRRTVSEPLAKALVTEARKPEPEVNPLLVQVVLEMYLVHFCSSKIDSWFPGTRETSDFLTTIYSEIRRTEEQAVSGRWRALTRAQIRPTSTTWRDEFMVGLGNIFKVAAWNIGSQENLAAFEQKLPAIFKAVEDLRLALGEKVTSIDLEVNVVLPGSLFNYQWMEDGYGDSRQGNMKKTGESVAGTTGIGLKKIIPSPSGESRFENVLSPKVVLVSTLQDALLPPSPAPSRSNRRGRGRVEGDQEGRSSPSKGPVEV
ncbi:hypothetical protein M413DRAFT_448958 [Hebeloma cylindrosporum]|uniref:Uncharacterized protein n=1 Tax=Hebeloma cylindrosporum TaxID=76867 RepID=A0A0C3BZH6_HEBCY|nr:hypothetical protein M413DRAFT_448958 [Hebeloma cylindrosporum h7]